MSQMPIEVRHDPTIVVGGYAVDVSTLTAPQKRVLTQFAGRLQRGLTRLSTATVTVTALGHTDSTGSERYNKGLGLRRAERAVEYLRLAVAAQLRSRVTYLPESAGEDAPVAPNRTMASRARNRRVELTNEWQVPTVPTPRPDPPRQPRTAAPSPVLRPSRDPIPCLDFRAMNRWFGPLRNKLENLYNHTHLVWLGEGYPITIAVEEPSSLAHEVQEEVLDSVFEAIPDAAKKELLEAEADPFAEWRLAWAMEVPASVASLLGLLWDARENRRIMQDPSGTEANILHRHLVAHLLAESLAKDANPEDLPSSVASLYIFLVKRWDKIGELEFECEKATGAPAKPSGVYLPRI